RITLLEGEPRLGRRLRSRLSRCCSGNICREAEHSRSRQQTDQSTNREKPGSVHGQPYEKQRVTGGIGIVAKQLESAREFDGNVRVKFPLGVLIYVTSATRGGPGSKPMPVEVMAGGRVSLAESEYRVLRQTIATRGTVRMAVVPLTIIGWSATTLVLMLFSQLPMGSLLSLAVLAAGFETVHALHVGVERIGRYLQVF